MTTEKNSNATPALFTNAQADLLAAAARADKDATKAAGKVVSAAAALVESGVTVAMIDKDAPTYAKAREIVGYATLTKAEIALVTDTSLAQKVKDESDPHKRVLTAAGKVHQRITMTLARIRAAMEPATRKPRTPTALKARLATTLAALVKAVKADEKADAPTFPAARRVELVAALERAATLAK